MKRNFIAILCFTLLFSLFLGGCTPEEKLQEKQNIEIYTLAYDGDITQAKEKAQKYYKGDKMKLKTVINKINSIADFIEENDSAFPPKNTPINNTTNKPEDDLEIQDGYKGTIKDGYIYISGSVTNESNRTISYYKITVKYFDDSKKNVVHSNYTNSGEDLYPSESREFEIMNKYNNYKNYQLNVEEVRFK